MTVRKTFIKFLKRIFLASVPTMPSVHGEHKSGYTESTRVDTGCAQGRIHESTGVDTEAHGSGYTRRTGEDTGEPTIE